MVLKIRFRLAVALGVAAAMSGLAVAQLPVAQGPAPTLSAERFAANPYMENPELSPDGLYIAAKMDVNGKVRLVLWPLDEKMGQPVSVANGEELGDIVWWRWINNDWMIATTMTSKKVDGEETRFSRTFSINRKTGQVHNLGGNPNAQNVADPIWIARDGTPRMLLGVQQNLKPGPGSWTEVLAVDVSTGTHKTLIAPRENFTSYHADNTGTVRAAVRYDDKNQTSSLFYRSNGTTELEEVDRADHSKFERLMVPFEFLAKPDTAVTISNIDGFDALHEIDLKTMTRGRKIFGLDRYDIDSYARTPPGNDIAGVMATDKRSRMIWLDPGIAAKQKVAETQFGADNIFIWSWDRQFTRFVVHVGAPDQPGAYYLYDTKAADKFRLLGYVDQALGMHRFAPMTTIQYEARDGLKLEAVLTLPKNRPAKNLPLIVLPHGGPEARDSEGWDWWVQFLAWRGYAVIQPNYRGSSGYGRRLLAAGYGEWGLKMQDDLLDAIDHLAAQGIADPKRVCIAGASYGGYAAMRAAQRDGPSYRCAISYAGVADLRGMSRFDGKFLNGVAASASWKSSAPDIDKVSPLRNPAGFTTPMLIVHGARDLRVPVRQSREMATKLKSAKKVYRYVEQPLGDHYFTRSQDKLQFLNEMDAWLVKYNPPN